MNSPINLNLNSDLTIKLNTALTKTQILISVTSIEEAQIALENGADIIDLKEPSLGALGALPLSKIQEIVTYVKGTKNLPAKLTSATIGDLPMEPELISAHVAQLVSTGVDIIKIGFFQADNYQPCLNALKTFAQTGAKLIAVFFAETTYPVNLIADIKNAGFIGIMLDTEKKNGLTLLDYYSSKQRMDFANSVLGKNLLLGLAGSLKIQHIPLIKEMAPNYIGFRGGVCHAGQRNLTLDAAKIKALSKTV